MTPQEFIAKWREVELKERSASQAHFIDLCHLLGVKDPITEDPKGDSFAFEKGASKTGGGEGLTLGMIHPAARHRHPKGRERVGTAGLPDGSCGRTESGGICGRGLVVGATLPDALGHPFTGADGSS